MIMTAPALADRTQNSVVDTPWVLAAAGGAVAVVCGAVVVSVGSEATCWTFTTTGALGEGVRVLGGGEGNTVVVRREFKSAVHGPLTSVDGRPLSAVSGGRKTAVAVTVVEVSSSSSSVTMDDDMV
jgi:hypothetical protein